MSAIGEWGARDGADYLPSPTMVAELLPTTVDGAEPTKRIQQQYSNPTNPGCLAFVDEQGHTPTDLDISTRRATITDPFGQPKAYGYTVSDAMLLRDGPIDPNLVYFGFRKSDESTLRKLPSPANGCGVNNWNGVAARAC